MSLLSLLLRPRSLEERQSLSVEAGYVVVGGGGGQQVAGVAEFPRGVEITGVVGGFDENSQLDEIVALGGSDNAGLTQNPGYANYYCLTVSGAGSSEYNGQYCPAEPFGPFSFGYAPSWRLGTTDKYLYLKDGLTWAIGSPSTGTVGYFLNSLVLDEDGDPIYASPNFGVISTGDGSPPAPTIVPPAGVFWSTGVGNGLIYLSYDGTLPELVVDGLTFTQETVYGRRAYTFTAGSGTITFP